MFHVLVTSHKSLKDSDPFMLSIYSCFCFLNKDNIEQMIGKKMHKGLWWLRKYSKKKKGKAMETVNSRFCFYF